jgi:hypothetical protein
VISTRCNSGRPSGATRQARKNVKQALQLAAHDQLWQIFAPLKQTLKCGAAAMALDTWLYQQLKAR